jgi:hypothetical protein
LVSKPAFFFLRRFHEGGRPFRLASLTISFGGDSPQPPR